MKPFTKKEKEFARELYEKLQPMAREILPKSDVYPLKPEWEKISDNARSGWKLVARWHLTEVKRLSKTPTECARGE